MLHIWDSKIAKWSKSEGMEIVVKMAKMYQIEVI